VIILDTDILTIVQRGTGREYSHLIERLDAAPSQPVCVTIISFEEQMRGWLAFIARAKTVERQVGRYAKLRSLLEDFQTRPVLDFDDAALAEFQRLTAQRTRIGTMDLKIAAIALVHEAILISQNLVDFRRVPNLNVEDWTV
jgi:tRNA(fMet)-specific endonuclease VapC